VEKQIHDCKCSGNPLPVMFGDSKRKILACPTNFHSSAAQTPGRMNILNFKKVLIDFAHNASGYKGIESTYKV
jgi:UDP-N-acetylmuramyl tripeptide synthase